MHNRSELPQFPHLENMGNTTYLKGLLRLSNLYKVNITSRNCKFPSFLYPIPPPVT